MRDKTKKACMLVIEASKKSGQPELRLQPNQLGEVRIWIQIYRPIDRSRSICLSTYTHTYSHIYIYIRMYLYIYMCM